jgi:GH24 family phage-related lysozyme (muramidase)
MAEIYKYLHHLDVLVCNHGGFVELIASVRNRKTFIEDDLRPVCDQDLLKFCYVFKCPTGCKRIVSIEEGLARDTELKAGAIPLLGNLKATTDKGGTVTWDNSLAAQLAIGEGKFKHKYIDSVGVPTVGIGFNMIKDHAKDRINATGADYDKVLAGKQDLSDDQINTLFKDDQTIAENSAKNSITDFDNLPADKQKALTDMTFNLGSFSHWPNFVKAVNAGDWAKAAKEAGTGKNGKGTSKWVKQVGNRAKRIIAQLRGDNVFGAPQ